MRVICIDATINMQAPNPCKPLFKEGQCLDVEQCSQHMGNYKVLQYPNSPQHGKPVSWRKERFIPLSSIDEKELQKEREVVTVNF